MCFCSSVSFAAVQGTIVDIDNENHEIAIQTKSSLIRKGSLLKLSGIKSGLNCHFKVIERTSDSVIASTEGCALKLKVGQKLVKTKSSNKISSQWSAPQQNKVSSSVKSLIDDNGKTIESWYILWGLGTGSTKYDSSMQEAVDITTEIIGAPKKINVDLFGLYWPKNQNKTLVGVVYNNSGETWTVKNDSSTTSDSVSINHGMLGFSVYHFITSTIGDAWFLRGDIGVTKYTISGNKSSSLDYSRSGSGVIVGGGYAWPFKGSGTRFMLSLLGSYKKSDQRTTNNVSLMGGFLF